MKADNCHCPIVSSRVWAHPWATSAWLFYDRLVFMLWICTPVTSEASCSSQAESMNVH